MPSLADSPILRTEGLSRSFGKRLVLDHLNLSIRRGEIFGYIGPNGAGKTTTFRILCGLLEPSAGHAFVADQMVTGNKDLIKQLVGYLPDNFGVYPAMNVQEYLAFFCAAYKIPRRQRSARIDACLEFAAATDFRRESMSGLSRGIKQRIGIAKTLLHDPQVLLLDEPLATVDPHARVQIRQLLRHLADMGKAVLVSSHILPELADVCDSVGILCGGKLLASGPVAEILRTVNQKRLIEIHVLRFPTQTRQVLAAAPGHWQPLDNPQASAIPAPGMANTMRYEVQADEVQLAQALLLLLKRGIPVVGYAEIPADLEDVFMHFTRSPGDAGEVGSLQANENGNGEGH